MFIARVLHSKVFLTHNLVSVSLVVATILACLVCIFRVV